LYHTTIRFSSYSSDSFWYNSISLPSVCIWCLHTSNPLCLEIHITNYNKSYGRVPSTCSEVSVDAYKYSDLGVSTPVTTATNSVCNYLLTRQDNRWRSIDAHFNVLSSQNLLPSILVFIIIWTLWMLFWLIETHSFGKAKPGNILAQVGFIPLKVIYLSEWFIWPAILLCMNQYSHATAHYSPIMFL